MKWNRWLMAAALFTLLLIWLQSALSVSQSSGESAWVLNVIVNPMLRFFGLGDISQGLLRKLAHVSEFAFFSFWLVILLRGKLTVSLGIGFLAATLDESIQLFSDRSAEVTDIWIDFIGVVLGTLLGALLWWLRDRRNGQTRENHKG